MKKIYICGHINHEQLQTTVKTFKQATIEMYQAGKNPVNITEKPLWDFSNRGEELTLRIKTMQACEEVFVLPSWDNDRLAHIELAAAIVLGKTIIYANDTIKTRQIVFFTN
jgi:Domain of unknown function (DUF4406)